MTLVDPMELLLALDPFLGERGEIKSIDDIDKITGFMQKADNLVGRCVYVNVLEATSSEDILAKFIEAGGWDLLNNWLQEAKSDDNTPFLLQLLNLYVHMPVSVSLLKSNNCAKTIKTLAKNDESDLKSVSGVIVEKWMKRIRDLREPEEQESRKRKDGRHKDRKDHKDKSEHRKDKDRSRDKDRRKSKSVSDAKESGKSTDSKKPEKKEEERESIVIRVSKHGGVTKVSRPSPKTTNDPPKDEKAEALKRPHADSMSSGANLKNIKIPKLSNKDKTSTNGPEKKDDRRPGVLDQKERPKTVKTYNSKFRSTGLETAAPLPSKKKKVPTATLR